MTIEWEEPPEQGDGRLKYAHVFDELQANPGKWGVWRRQHNAANNYSDRQGYQGLEWAVRKTGPGEWTIYARWPEQ